jgi:hypothetical protein
MAELNQDDNAGLSCFNTSAQWPSVMYVREPPAYAAVDDVDPSDLEVS